ncbi:MAG TPA: BolA/IbaG family iron-sulfur metabolism protein [Spongiibacteraceae bacterium]|nr:BolA/IbaG family iron-sulfur metabolism protein [Spongiibacteraceae bacterium]
MQPDEVKQLLQSRLSGCEVEVDGDGRHFAIRVIGEVFAGLSPVKKQQLVYGALSEEFASGSIHAVDQLVTLTPAEWRQRQAQ